MIEKIDNKIYAQFTDKKEDITVTGCVHRIRLQADIETYEKEIQALEGQIQALKDNIKVKEHQDIKLAEAGFCKIDFGTPIRNALTGVTMTIKKEHQPHCVVKGDK